jgi:hypothetical protein
MQTLKDYIFNHHNVVMIDDKIHKHFSYLIITGIDSKKPKFYATKQRRLQFHKTWPPDPFYIWRGIKHYLDLLTN